MFLLSSQMSNDQFWNSLSYILALSYWLLIFLVLREVCWISNEDGLKKRFYFCTAWTELSLNSRKE